MVSTVVVDDGIMRRAMFAGVAFGSLGVLAATTHRLLLLLDAPLSAKVRGHGLADLFRSVSSVGATETAAAAALVVAVLMWRRCRAFAIIYPATLLMGAVLNVVLKVVIARPRPPDPDAGVALASFPSGHTFQAALVLGMLPLALLTVSRWVPLTRAAIAVATIGTAAVALSRVYLGAHWPIDVVGGAVIGFVLVEAAHLTLLKTHRTGRCTCALTISSGNEDS